MSLCKQKSSTQIDLNRTRLKEFINLNVYIPDFFFKSIKKSDLNKTNAIFFLNHDFFNLGVQ